MEIGKSHRILGAAFIFQFITSFTNSVFIKKMWFVPDNIHETLLNIGHNTLLFRFSIFLDALTAVGVIFLGACLYYSLKKTDSLLSTAAFGLYIAEGSLLAASKSGAVSLQHISSLITVNMISPEMIQAAEDAVRTMDFLGKSMHMLFFCIGALLFYYVLYKSQIVPKWISLWGIVSLLPLLTGTVARIFSCSIPFAFYIPYVPFELFIGIWIAVNGVPESKISDSI